MGSLNFIQAAAESSAELNWTGTTARTKLDHRLGGSRSSKLFKTHIIGSDGNRVEVTVRNLSREGAGLKANQPLRAGKRVWLVLTGIGEIAGEVRWQVRHNFGIRFDVEIEPEQLQSFADAWELKAEIAMCKGFDLLRPSSSTWRPSLRTR